MFQKQIGTSMEMYIDDMLVKSVKVGLHVNHLAEAFQVLKDYKMKLNLTKCAFRVFAGKFLGFHSQQSWNRGKSRQNKGRTRHETALKH